MADQEEGMDLPDLPDLPDLTDEANLPAEEGANDAVMDTDDGEARTAADLEAVFDVPVNVSAVLGKTDIEISDLLKLDSGTTVELDRKVGEAIDIYVNDRLVARGEVVIVEEQLGVTMTEIIKGGAN